MVGTDPTLRMAAQVARMLGHLTIVGLGGAALPVDFSSPPHGCSVASPYWGSLTELMDVITLAQQEKIKVLVEHFPLQRANEAYQLLHDAGFRDVLSSPPTRDCRRQSERDARHASWATDPGPGEQTFPPSNMRLIG
ncbi:hypothetical protein ACIPSA_11990 [Streptomyces sp. NPDC086549]|uniref:hypothetical protein n=1 Tax=Streptomyces sp. NPDC086549 TaxID=3365752 RepID=UPI0037FEA3D0